ncbi:MAG: energy-coupling factor ABC transporter ATP-binding protein [Bifidobacteriaceae bacterium]|jgi:energy-coupling factor transport system ATP-binding protein|nr:energy-coupling factor ABC transporter ATP-binding protein [Bifidobacteriaceae bacterium]
MSIELDHVAFSYPDGTRVFDDLTASIEAGSRVAVVGQNGAGKTTLAKLMNGLLKPTKGTVVVDGMETRKATTAQIARQVAYVYQNPDDQLFKPKVRDEITYLSRVLRRPSDEVEEQLGINAELAGVAAYLDANPKDLPLAIRRFVAVASLLMGQANYFILDEPTGGIDLPGTVRLLRIMDSLSARGIGVITISHDMRFVVEHFDRIIAVSEGQIVADGAASTVFGDDDVLRRCALYRPKATQFARDVRLPGDPYRLEEIATALRVRIAGHKGRRDHRTVEKEDQL